MLEKAFDKNSISKPKVYESYKHTTSATKENMRKVKDIMLSNCGLTIRKTTEEVGVLYRSCKAVFTIIFGMKHVGAKCVPNLLIFCKSSTAKTSLTNIVRSRR